MVLTVSGCGSLRSLSNYQIAKPERPVLEEGPRTDLGSVVFSYPDWKKIWQYILDLEFELTAACLNNGQSEEECVD